ncbi:putative nucleotide-binding protein (sugar kinase/HSP70/actin superfamily) [Ruminiclostridium sufflavum DSM 19573]|uniref:Putative nucleotide-binding protein (Sugar kinase/HSP70/actin superfamily) n=1 Tax=Ruminiclostridium sufflavum DSM 19573 TaxID=1121337 RepID=A0A318XK42_9FIRM|nr:acyl-CoA dehydratase activase-related protein [Ruminiclostridium sufflavum]PYG86906.1 putative nucleotide-binding protein (sugar kinase/HSP70/actin superfamily) [Ruminiclostridium sufflavum DSM 19573]
MIKVGIPRGLYYYKYSVLWETFFRELGAEVVLSDKTNKNILTSGANACVSEACLPIKIYFGHVMNLAGKVDYIFMPRFTSISKNQYICPEICGVPDMIKNSVKILPKIIDTEINLRKTNKNSLLAALRVGGFITNDREKIKNAYKAAVKAYQEERQILKSGVLTDEFKQDSFSLRLIQKRSTQLTVAVIGHSYTVYDSYINMELIKKLKAYGVGVVTLDMLDYLESKKKCKELNKMLFWDYGTRAYGGVKQLIESGQIDGILALTSFGCGVDSFVDELAEKKVRSESDIPFMKIVLDEHSAEAGFCTRLEAFIDMIVRRKAYDFYISTSG